MWAAILNDENEFQSVVNHLSKALLLDFPVHTTATGARIAQSKQNSAAPCFAFAPDNQESINHVLLWLQHNLQPQVYVSTGLVRSCGTPFLESAYFVPDICVRSAGRADFGGAPILYEEFTFDTVAQMQIRALLELKTEKAQKIFGPSKDVPSVETRGWILENFHTQATDPSIGQFVRTVRSLGSASACLKVHSETSKPLEALCQAWEKVVAKMLGQN